MIKLPTPVVNLRKWYHRGGKDRVDDLSYMGLILFSILCSTALAALLLVNFVFNKV
jgi:hypothetical protein